MMTPQEFATATGYRRGRSFKTGFRKSSSALSSIYDDLVVLQTLPKTNLEARWQLLSSLGQKCDLYLEAKRLKGKDLTKPKYAAVERFSSGFFGQLVKEQRKAAQVHGRMQSSGTGIAPGVKNPHHGNVKFERALLLTKGPQAGMTFHGQNIYMDAQADGVQFTGNELTDAYKLRAYFKANVQKLIKNNQPLLEFLNTEQERAQYELTFSATRVLQNGQPFSTQGSTVSMVNEGFCVADPGGTWYAAVGKSLSGGWHHSSFLAGGDVLFAGTIGCSNIGTPQFVTNASGHYSPDFDDLLAGLESLKASGLNTPTLAKISVMYQDFAGIFGGQRYLFPLLQLSATGRRFPSPQNYVLKAAFADWEWQNPNPATRHRNSPPTGPNGQIQFPA
jgi:hypothetical protein